MYCLEAIPERAHFICCFCPWSIAGIFYFDAYVIVLSLLGIFLDLSEIDTKNIFFSRETSICNRVIYELINDEYKS